MVRCRLTATIAFVSSLLLGAGGAFAQDGYKAPFIERGLGATNVQATTGNSGLTAGISKHGDLSVLSWPSPSYYDQLHYITSNAPDAREQPRFGAPKRAGVFAGLVVKEQGASETDVTYFRNWETVNITYLEPDASVVVTTFEHPDLGLKAKQYDLIPKDRDVLIRRYRVEVTGNTSFETLDLMAYSNLTTNRSKVPQVPLLDVLMDHYNDFLAVWRKDEDAIVQFHPDDTGVVRELPQLFSLLVEGMGVEMEFGPIGQELEKSQPDSSKIQQLATSLDDEYAEGVYATMSSTPAPESFQIGEDETEFCKKIDELVDNVQALGDEGTLPAPPEAAGEARCNDEFDPVETVRSRNNWSYEAEDAFTDAKDGTLNEQPVAGGQINTALRVPLNLSNGSAEASLYYAFGSTAEESMQTLDWAEGEDTSSIQQSIVQADQSFVDSLWIPEEIEGGLRKFIVRSFLNLRVGTDRETGAIVASISRQPSYQLDWPRDGAFFNTALDLSGQHELVTKRMKFYSETMRKEPKDPFPVLNSDGAPNWPGRTDENAFPPHSWEMNYYADGMTGGNIRLEIDNTALLIWSYVAHAGFLEGEARADYIDQVWPTVKKSANFVHSWKDPETNLMWPANEDDHAEYTQGLQGANTSYLALQSAARMARHLDKNDLADKWESRAEELKQATLDLMYTEEHGFYDYENRDNKSKGAAGRPWLGWPTHFLDYDDPRLRTATTQILEKQVREVRGEAGNGNYPTKAAISAAIVFEEGEEGEQQRKQALKIAERLATKIANQDTWTIGETIVPVDKNGDGETEDFINGVSTPHLWSSTLVYLTAVAYYHPEKFDQYRSALGPQSSGGDAGMGIGTDAGRDAGRSDAGTRKPKPESDGCGCLQSGRGAGSGAPWSLALFALLACGTYAGRRRLI